MSAARQNGSSTWSIDVDGDPEKMNAKVDLVLGSVIETMQRAVCFLVNQRDTNRLLALQTCYNTVLQQADTALSQGKFMEISNSIEDRLN